ncbi:phosphonate C-P lyase system protein PhnH [Roseomonas terrae]|jgi:alpha-D-ribose 1-methylphosphonate 5-triphosphate synthase subunit PhnH|uniref:Phosphonate C-P lyase system protein PhnH n=1 Tax=Neoroseomonas terrae TaxID=424799 RepID=A0ABS5EKP5_9PROT|nr:phosphonate C-P lyase system protein PhnH [Neoroseomonas terrae]MBR0651578.1 phosphonate C-P lyase system protein PhnH [Neoroseomonas terrae]
MTGLTPGFADPALDAQASFRAVLEAMSRPGRIQRTGSSLHLPAPLGQATAAVLLALADADTGFAHDAGAAAEAWLRFHCGMPLVPAGEATFVLATGAPPALATLCQGSEEEPQASATLVIQVAGLAEDEGWHLTGPGIETEHRLRVDGAPEGFVAAWAANRAGFPCGVDVVLCAGDRLAALPRTVMIAEG